MAGLMRLLQDRMRMLRDDAKAVAEIVESAFRGSDEVDDEMLDKDLRQVFYDLQDEHILEIRRQDEHRDGREERHFYWRVADVELRGVAGQEPAHDEEAAIYRRLKDHAWERRRPFDPSLA